MIETMLKGDSMRERHRNLNLLIAKVTSEDFTPAYIASLSTKCQLDQIFLARLADRFKNSSVVCNLLKSEDAIVVSYVLKCKWFFEGTINKDVVNSDYLFTNLFPFVTYATRCKIISNLGIHLKDQQMAEILYVKISEEYGNTVAVKLLSLCSEKFIENQLKIDKFELPAHQLKRIYIKYPKFIIEYVKNGLENDYMNFLRSECSAVFELIAQDNMVEMVEIFKLYKGIPPSMNLGYRLTLSLLECDKQYVIDNSSKIYQRLNYEALFKVIKGEERDRFIMNVFPRKSKEFNFRYEVNQIFKHFKSEYASNYLIELYKKAYNGENMIDSDSYPEQYVTHLSTELKDEWIKKMMSHKGVQEERYLKYKKTDVAIKRFMELNNSTPNVDKRITILTSMIECCKINDDTVALLNVLKYVAKRHRNDNENLRHRFLESLQTTFVPHKLSADHWEVIDEMLKIMLYNDEIKKHHRQYFLTVILEQSIHYRMINNIEYESVIDMMMEYNLNKLNLLTDYPELEKKVLDLFIERYKPLIMNQVIDDDVKSRIVLVLEAYLKKSDESDHKRSIQDLPWLVEVIKSWSQTSNDKDNHRILRVLARDVEAKKIFIDDIFKHIFDSNIFKCALTHDAKVILNNFDTVVKYFNTSYGIRRSLREFQRIRAYMNDTLGQIIRQRLEDDIANYQEERSTGFAVLIVNLLLLRDDCDDILKNYVPITTKIVVSENPEVQIEYRRNQELIQNFKYVNPPLSYDTVLLFAKDDYFKFGLPSILSMCYRKNGIETCAFVKELAKKPVSVKKHSIRLSHFLLPKQEVLSIYEEMWNVEKNSSIRDVLFQRTFKIFTKELDLSVCAKAFTMIKKFFEGFRESDKNLFCYLQNVDGIKKEFISEYCEVSWNTLKALEKRKLDVDNYQSDLVYTISSKIECVSEQFCEVLVKEYLNLIDQSNKSVVSSLSYFCINYLVRAKSLETQSKHLTEFCSIIGTFISQKWDTLHESKYKYRTSIKDFLKSFCSEALVYKFTINPSFLLKTLHEMIKGLLPFEAVPDIMLHFLFSISFTEFLEQPFEHRRENNFEPEIFVFLQKFAGSVTRLFEFFMTTYGSEVLGLFTTILSDVLNSTRVNELFKLYFIKQLLLNERKTRPFMLLVMGLLPTHIDHDNAETAAVYKQLLEEVSSYNDKAVKMVYGQKFEMPSSYYRD